PAALDSLELVVPIVAAGEEALNHADDADAAGARLDDPLRRERRGARAQVLALRGEPVRRLPGHNRCGGVHAGAKVGGDGAALALFDFGWDEPRRDAGPRRNRLPDL